MKALCCKLGVFLVPCWFCHGDADCETTPQSNETSSEDSAYSTVGCLYGCWVS